MRMNVVPRLRCMEVVVLFASLLLCLHTGLIAQEIAMPEIRRNLDNLKSRFIVPSPEDAIGDDLDETLTAEEILAGNHWSWGNPTPQPNNLYAVDLYIDTLNQDTVLGAVGEVGTFVHTSDGGATWHFRPYS